MKTKYSLQIIQKVLFHDIYTFLYFCLLIFDHIVDILPTTISRNDFVLDTKCLESRAAACTAQN